MPVLQQLTPLRPPSDTPRAVACEVHDSVLDMVDLAEARIPERAKINYLLPLDASEVSRHNGQEVSGVRLSDFQFPAWVRNEPPLQGYQA